MKILNKISVVLSIINLAIVGYFWLRYASPIAEGQVEFISKTESLGSFLSAQASHYALLQIYLVAISIVIAIVGFMGYNEIKRGAEKKAEVRVNELLPSLVKQEIEKLNENERSVTFFNNKLSKPSKKSAKESIEESVNPF